MSSLHEHESSYHHDDADTDVVHPPLARMGRWAHGHRTFVVITWAVLAIGLGVFAPRLEHALSGAMWEIRQHVACSSRRKLILGTAELLDAFLIRLVLVPATLYIIGDRAWWLPRWTNRILPKVKFAH